MGSVGRGLVGEGVHWPEGTFGVRLQNVEFVRNMVSGGEETKSLQVTLRLEGWLEGAPRYHKAITPMEREPRVARAGH